MSQAKTILHHLCSLVEADLHEAYPALKTIFIIYEYGQYENALNAKLPDIQKHPAGTCLAEKLKTIKPDSKNLVTFGAIARPQKHTLPGFLWRKKSIVCLYVNADAFDNEEEAKLTLYHNIFLTLHLYETLKTAPPNENAISITSYPKDASYLNMLGDAFAAFFFELSDRTGMIKTLAKKRCLQSLEKTLKYPAEIMPFPIIIDMANLVFKDMKHQKQKALPLAYAMTKEVELTCDDNITRQWLSFIGPAIEMAWSNASIKDILGAAAYTSESVFNRSIAYLISEILTTEPTSLNNLPSFNPFMDIEAQDRLHKRRCQEKLEASISNNAKADTKTLLKAAKKQCDQFLDGNIIGWCAPALIEAALKIELHKNTAKCREEIQLVFQNTAYNLSWPAVKAVHHDLTNLRRNGQTATIVDMIEFLRRDEQSRDAALSLKKLSDWMNTQKINPPHEKSEDE